MYYRKRDLGQTKYNLWRGWKGQEGQAINLLCIVWNIEDEGRGRHCNIFYQSMLDSEFHKGAWSNSWIRLNCTKNIDNPSFTVQFKGIGLRRHI